MTHEISMFHMLYNAKSIQQFPHILSKHCGIDMENSTSYGFLTKSTSTPWDRNVTKQNKLPN